MVWCGEGCERVAGTGWEEDGCWGVRDASLDVERPLLGAVLQSVVLEYPNIVPG